MTEDMGKPRRRLLMVAANPTTSPTTGWPIGFWWSELTHPYWTFTSAGYEVVIASPEGGKLEPDAYSDPEHESGYSSSDILSLGFKRSPEHRELLAQTPAVRDLDMDEFDAVFFVGGQAPMVSYPGSRTVLDLLSAWFDSGRPTALVCHATCLLLEARTSEGDLLVAGRTWTGFADAEERFADQVVGQKIQPFWIEEEARKLEGTHFLVEQAFRPFAVRDGNLITGQQQHSGEAAARLVIQALGQP